MRAITTYRDMLDTLNERQLSDWTAIYNTPDSRLYKRLVELGWTEAPGQMRRSERSDELLLLAGADEA